jgi:PadR family transcriptional regulator PadR
MSPATLRVIEALRSGQDPKWGLQIIKETGLPSGSVYPILARLEALEIVTSEWEEEPTRPGARRRIYSINNSGLEKLHESSEALRSVGGRKLSAPGSSVPGLATN